MIACNVCNRLDLFYCSGCSSISRAGHLPKSRWFNPQLVQSTCRSVFGQDSEPHIAPDGRATGVWMSSLHRSRLAVNVCVNWWMLTCDVKTLWVAERLEKPCISLFTIYFIQSFTKSSCCIFFRQTSKLTSVRFCWTHTQVWKRWNPAIETFKYKTFKPVVFSVIAL